ncbi:type II toxin-antitoxin system VapC family toxin [Phreatobacter cathodiphilus]|uniref:Ribonuclease VapC n=1 Tax=Phreatobacter cathodiphilus TaxID=1868589 RepID=A0A2S0N9V7_9HYPH|nr:type II toxin-antitoxin system VapC family toxin [Phreatobacter cathodiphilus]AVO44787.1 VapC toxin family PIN domain ribonuclease [Phreatobacter cathodiphilus]
MIVADTNVIAYLLIPSPFTEMAEQLYTQDTEWVAPALWRSEFRNVLSLYMRRSLLSLDQAVALQEEAEDLLRGNEYDVVSADVLALSRDSGCSAYDCEFVVLARFLGVPLVTADRRLARAFPQYARPLETAAG